MVGRTALALTRWTIAGDIPDLPKYVIIVAPHTSNWDFFYACAARLALDLDASWVGKHTIFRWPVKGLLRRLGGIPVDRAHPHGLVGTIVDEFSKRSHMIFALAPEGTRRRVEQWRSGYWHIAHDAGVPIVPVGLDYANKRIVIGPLFTTTDSIQCDERTLRAFFASMHPRHPENYDAGLHP